jgi:hypothetical protein
MLAGQSAIPRIMEAIAAMHEEHRNGKVVDEQAGDQPCLRSTAVAFPRQPARNAKSDQGGACDSPKDERLRRRQSCPEQELDGQ